MNSGYPWIDLTRQYQAERLKEAENFRLLADSRPNRLRFRDRLILKGANLLITFGSRLKSVAEPEFEAQFSSSVPNFQSTTFDC